jgi:hypothetical protein
MAERAPAGEATACLQVLEAALGSDAVPDLSGCSESALDWALRAIGRARGPDSLPLVRRLAEAAPDKRHRKVARRALYRLSGRGQPTSPPPEVVPVVRRQVERPVLAWLSGIDGTGSRAMWIVFEGGLGGGLHLCSLIVNDQAGILDAAGGPISKRRLADELRSIRQDQKLPWVEEQPAHACALVHEALALHRGAGTAPPAAFDRWRPLFDALPAAPPAEAADIPAAPVDASLLERAPELLSLPELQDWFADPEALHEDAVALLEARDSRLVVPDIVKAEREAAIVARALERAFTPEWRMRWARRLLEMARIFLATERPEPARLAEATARALGTTTMDLAAIPLARVIAMRGLEVACDVALGRARLSQVSRKPREPERA